MNFIAIIALIRYNVTYRGEYLPLQSRISGNGSFERRNNTYELHC